MGNPPYLWVIFSEGMCRVCACPCEDAQYKSQWILRTVGSATAEALPGK